MYVEYGLAQAQISNASYLGFSYANMQYYVFIYNRFYHTTNLYNYIKTEVYTIPNDDLKLYKNPNPTSITYLYI